MRLRIGFWVGSAGQSFTISGLAAGEVVSVQSSGQFTYTTTTQPATTTTQPATTTTQPATTTTQPATTTTQPATTTTQPATTTTQPATTTTQPATTTTQPATTTTQPATTTAQPATTTTQPATTTTQPATTTTQPATTTTQPATTTTQPATTTTQPATTTSGPGTGPAASVNVTWTCSSSPCPWGSPIGNPALVWPASMSALSGRLGYTTSAAVYAPASSANGVSVGLISGSATVYAGLPDATSHRVLGWISAGQSFTISGLAAGEVVSVQSSGQFTYTTTTQPATTTTQPATTTTQPATTTTQPATTTTQPATTTTQPATTTTQPATTTTQPATTTTQPSTTTTQPSTTTSGPGTGPAASVNVTWTCSSSPCPWGSPIGNPALVWPASMSALSGRLGYTTSAAVYAPASSANGVSVGLISGSATVYAGLPDATSHRVLGWIRRASRSRSRASLRVRSSVFKVAVSSPTPRRPSRLPRRLSLRPPRQSRHAPTRWRAIRSGQ